MDFLTLSLWWLQGPAAFILGFGVFGSEATLSISAVFLFSLEKYE